MTLQNEHGIVDRNSQDQFRTIVDRLLSLLQNGISPFVELQMQAKYKMAWIERANRHLARAVDPAFFHFDVHALLKIIVGEWDSIFQVKLTPVEKTHVQGLIALRNRWAHQRPIPANMLRAGLASTHQVLEAIGSDLQAQQVADLQDRFAQILQEASKPQPELEGPLRPWVRIGLTLLLLAVLMGVRLRTPSLGTSPTPPPSPPTLAVSYSVTTPVVTVPTTVTVTATATVTTESAQPNSDLLPSPTITTPTPIVYDAVSVAPSNLRAGPGTSYPIVGTVMPNLPLRIVGRDRTDQWYKLESGAWIAAFLADIDPALPVVGPDPTATPSPIP